MRSSYGIQTTNGIQPCGSGLRDSQFAEGNQESATQGLSNEQRTADQLPASDEPNVDSGKLTGETKMMMLLLDLNDNGQLESDELEGDAKEMLDGLDSNRDGIITSEELNVESSRQLDVHSKLADIDTRQNLQRIVDLPPGTHSGLNRHFVKYTNIMTPDSQPIHILAMDAWSNERILRARKVLEHFLTDVPDRRWGDKTALANAMADNHATLVLLNDDREIRNLAKQSSDSGLWNYDEPNMPGNHFEYIICVYDNYFDLWKNKPAKMEGRAANARANHSVVNTKRTIERPRAPLIHLVLR